jgi:site-specific recombinase XerD
MKNNFAKYLTGFFTEYLSGERGASHHTIRSYSNTFALLLDFMNEVRHIKAEKLSIEHLTRDSVLSFLQWIGDTKKCSTSTRNQRLAAIHSFCKYLQYEDVIHLKQWQDDRCSQIIGEGHRQMPE